MSGLNATTGRPLADLDHIRQSVRDILITPIGSRIERRTYGSLLPDLIDQPANPANRLRLMAATVMAILQWEPRLSLNSVSIALDLQGNAQIDMDATRKDGQRAGHRLNISVPLK